MCLFDILATATQLISLFSFTCVYCLDRNDPNTYQLAQRYGVRSMPTFVFFYNGKKVNEYSGAGEQQLRHLAQKVVRRS